MSGKGELSALITIEQVDHFSSLFTLFFLPSHCSLNSKEKLTICTSFFFPSYVLCEFYRNINVGSLVLFSLKEGSGGKAEAEGGRKEKAERGREEERKGREGGKSMTVEATPYIIFTV